MTTHFILLPIIIMMMMMVMMAIMQYPGERRSNRRQKEKNIHGAHARQKNSTWSSPMAWTDAPGRASPAGARLEGRRATSGTQPHRSSCPLAVSLFLSHATRPSTDTTCGGMRDTGTPTPHSTSHHRVDDVSHEVGRRLHRTRIRTKSERGTVKTKCQAEAQHRDKHSFLHFPSSFLLDSLVGPDDGGSIHNPDDVARCAWLHQR